VTCDGRYRKHLLAEEAALSLNWTVSRYFSGFVHTLHTLHLLLHAHGHLFHLLVELTDLLRIHRNGPPLLFPEERSDERGSDTE
jgi:hypothetical protein